MADISKKTLGELHKEIMDKREALRVIRFGAEGSRSRNVRETRTIRREIARLLTQVNSRKVAQ